MQPVLFDSSIYISAFRGGKESIAGLRRLSAEEPLWLSAVVLAELYAGAGERDRHAVERLERDFEGIKRIVIPNLRDWVHAGRALCRLTAKYHYEKIGQGRLTNDALIAMSAGRLGIKVITANQRDFGRLAEFRPFQYQIATV